MSASSTTKPLHRKQADPGFEYIFPAIRGLQAGREYYISMCPLRLIPKIFLFNEEELRPELRAQRALNKARLPEIARYVIDNPKDYVFSALTASVDADIIFQPLGANGSARNLGHLQIPMDARFVINDGQHRRAAIEIALAERPELSNESIAVVMFLDIGLRRCQQMFSDLNRHAIRPSTSIGVLYDHRDRRAELARLVVSGSPLFQDVVELERSTLSPRSRKLFTLSAIYSATVALMSHIGEDASAEKSAQIAIDYWEEVSLQFPEWAAVRDGRMSAGEVRRDFIHSHGIVIQALGRVGNLLLRNTKRSWKTALRGLRSINWKRANAKEWEGRAMSGGRLSKADHHVALTTNFIKAKLDLPLTPDEQRIEDAFKRGEYAE